MFVPGEILLTCQAGLSMGLCYHRLAWGRWKRGSWAEGTLLLPAKIMSWRRQEKPKETAGREPAALLSGPALGALWMSCLSRAARRFSQATVQLHFAFLTDGQFNEPVCRGPADAAIPPVSKVQQDARSLLRVACITPQRIN